MVELLSPAGSMDALKAAIAGGCNAVYLGGSKFNARAFATNFNHDELVEAVKLCHLYGVRVFVTVNTLYNENQLDELYDYLKELYEMQVDALIVQSEGVISFVLKHFKDFEVHASTQCSIHNTPGVLYYQNKGVKRVVCARENTLDEIKEMTATGMDIEVFVHGALCISYSGQCQMSYQNGGRSANRGACAQPCRLPYTLLKDEKEINKESYLLSTKDLCTIDHIPELIEAGVASFKIEGRMKRPEYVYEVTKAYRTKIDDYYASINKDKIKQIFNREFSEGYIFNENQIVSPIYPGNRGVEIGKVTNYFKKSKRLQIQALDTIRQQDGIRFGFSEQGKVLNKIYVNGKLVSQVSKNELFEIDSDIFYKKDTIIYRTTSIELENEIHHDLKASLRKVPVSMTLYGYVGNKIALCIDDGMFSVTVSNDTIIEIAKNRPDLNRLTDTLKKLGNTIYTCEDIILDIDEDSFIPVSILNELRRNACEKLDTLRANRKVREVQHMDFYDQTNKINHPSQLIYQVHTLDQLNALMPLKEDESIYIDDYLIYKEAKKICPSVGISINSIASQKVIDDISDIVKEHPNVNLALNQIGLLDMFKKNVKVLLPGCNLINSIDLDIHDKLVITSVEMERNDKIELRRRGYHFGSQVYGYINNMITKYCPVSFNQFNKKVERCMECKKGAYCLKDRLDVKFPMMFTSDCICHILSSKPIHTSREDISFIRFTIEEMNAVSKIAQSYRIEL